MSDPRLKVILDRLYDGFDFNSSVMNDPIEFPRRYLDECDIEIVAFLSTVFAYGRVDLFKSFLEKVFGAMGRSPYSFITNFDKSKDSKYFRGLKYRFSDERDLTLLIRSIKSILLKWISLGSMFSGAYVKHGTIRHAMADMRDEFLETASSMESPGRGFRHFLPSPLHGSPCKRLNLFLRWMVRDRDVDLGLWKEIPGNRLVIPLDTHIARIGRCLEFTKRKNTDWKTAEEITDALKSINPDDPLKYDFVLCHQGISGLCRDNRELCARCALKNPGKVTSHGNDRESLEIAKAVMGI